MPQNITDQPVFTSPVVAPLDGEAGTAASVLAGIQALANRTAYMNGLLTVSGVQNIRNGTAAQLIAIPHAQALGVFLVEGVGLYFYDATSSAVADGNLVVAPSDIGSSNGRWIHELKNLANTNPGIAMVGLGGASSGRIPASVVPNGFQASLVIPLAANQSVTGNSWTDLPTFTANFGGTQPGDKVYIWGQFVGIMLTSGTGALSVATVDGASTNLLQPTLAFNSASFAPTVGFFALYTVVTGGTLTVKGQGLGGGSASTIQCSSGSTITAVLTRP